MTRRALDTLRRDPVAVGSFAVLLLVVVACLLAPGYETRVAATDAFASNVSGTTVVDGRRVPVLATSTGGLGLGVTPIGPTGDPRHFLLGADSQGRDVAARLLYGGRNTLFIGFTAATLCCLLATGIGVVAGYHGGLVDGVASGLLDVLWAFPVHLLAICLSVVLLTTDLRLGPVTLSSDSLALPVAILALVYVPYVARPVRAQVRSLREREFVAAAVGVGASGWWIMRREILPNVLPAVVVLMPLMTSICMLTESALSFLSIGVQSPDASWGTIINDGLTLLYSRPVVAVAPGLALALTAAALNLLADRVADAFGVRSAIRQRRW